MEFLSVTCYRKFIITNNFKIKYLTKHWLKVIKVMLKIYNNRFFIASLPKFVHNLILNLNR